MRLVNSGCVFVFGEELAYIVDRAYQNDDGGTGDPHEEEDLKKSHAKDDQSHKG